MSPLLLQAALLLLVAPVAMAAWPPGYVNRSFHQTPKGFLHYVVHGDVAHTPPFVFFHGHPRSTEMFHDLALQLPPSQPFIAVDYFGAGHSDECLCNETADEFVTYNQFAVWVLDICADVGATKIVPFGALTGGSPAIELAGLAAEKGLVERLILFESYYLKQKAKQYVDNIYIPTIRHMPKYQNGSHLLDAWFRPDCGPLGPTSQVPAVEDLDRNEIKTIDWLLNTRTGWQFKMAWTAYNDDIIPRFKQLSAKGVKMLFLYAEYADALGNKYGLDHDWSEAHINAAVPEELRKISRVKNGTEGALEQNSTLVARFVKEFMAWQQDDDVMV